MKQIHKIIAIVIQNNKFLVVRKVGKEIHTNLGGRIEKGETEEECLIREIKEEMNLNSNVIRKLKDFHAKAIFDDAQVTLSAFLVELEELPEQGKINHIDPELEEYKFIDKDYKEKGIKLPPSLEEQVIPYCIEEGLLNW